jgi:hydrogenase maturation protein HypF
VIKVGVQHHHAHVASAMAEHGLPGPVIGVAYDGTGYGTDGTSWGGEILLARAADFERLATFRPIPLAGGDTAIRQVWRVALALLEDAYEGDPPLDRLRLFKRLDPRELAVVRQMIARGVHAPLARGVGRYFDGLGALVLGRRVSLYEGQVAFEWNMVADPAERSAYPFVVDSSASPSTLDPRTFVRAAVEDLLAGRSAATISARFHNTLVRATAGLVRRAREKVGDLPVVLTGGCFQNVLLAERIFSDLSSDCRVFLHRRVPPGDGGIALGQALVASAAARRAQGAI